MNNKPRILIARAISPEVVQRLQQHFEVQANQDDIVWTPQELAAQLQGKDGVLTTGSQQINAQLLAACPQLKIVANMAVGYNNFDVAAMTAAGVQGTNAPDVLTETTADFGFALLMATARRICESEHYLRAGKWKDWHYDLFAGAEVHGSTLGIIKKGRNDTAIHPEDDAAINRAYHQICTVNFRVELIRIRRLHFFRRAANPYPLFRFVITRGCYGDHVHNECPVPLYHIEFDPLGRIPPLLMFQPISAPNSDWRLIRRFS